VFSQLLSEAAKPVIGLPLMMGKCVNNEIILFRLVDNIVGETSPTEFSNLILPQDTGVAYAKGDGFPLVLTSNECHAPRRAHWQNAE
jgi:hypothetical protein